MPLHSAKLIYHPTMVALSPPPSGGIRAGSLSAPKKEVTRVYVFIKREMLCKGPEKLAH